MVGEKMSRYIDAEAIEKVIRKRVYAIEVEDILAEIANIPSADVVERKRGEWKIKEIKNAWGKGYMLTCSECGDTFKVTENAMPYEHFCRNCGAYMREREGE